MAGLLVVLSLVAAEPLAAGDHLRKIEVGGQTRSYVVHLPVSYQPGKPSPVVLALHGAGMNAAVMALFCGLNDKAEQAGFVTVYPNGTGAGIFLTFNAGGVKGQAGQNRPDDVAFLAAVLDDLATVVNVDAHRVYATGMSNGGMMCYRLAAELPGRIAAIAPVSGTMASDLGKPLGPVPVMHFHGTEDRIVPYAGPSPGAANFFAFDSVPQTIQRWVKRNGCRSKPVVERLPDQADDGTTVIRKTYSARTGGADVVLIEIQGGGHSWPGQPALEGFLGKATEDISANDLMWQFFQEHRLP